MEIIFSPKCLEYSFPRHPESPERVSTTYEFLKDRFDFLTPKPCRDSELLNVHTKSLIESVKQCKFEDIDTPCSPEMYYYAKLSVGSAIKSAKLCLKGKNAFSLMRPPGHHAGRDFLGGFCYFNNMAVAVKYIKNKGVRKIAILDIDCHHGNGTEDIFFGDESILYISIHQKGIFPGTGLKSRKNCLNFPLPVGTGENEYIRIVKKVINEVKSFGPEVIGISAGFDTYKGDPLCGFVLEIRTYKKIGCLIKTLDTPVFSLLEGGYSSKLKLCIESFLKGLIY